MCHVDISELDNGLDSIVELEHRVRDESECVFIDKHGFFRSLWDRDYFHRDHWELK